MKHLFILSPIIWLVWCKHPYTVHDSSWEKPVAESLIDTICTAVHNYQWQMCCSRCSRAPEQNSVCSWTGKHTSQLCCWTSTCAHNRCTGNTGNLLGYRTWTVRLRQSDCKCKDYGLLPVHRPGTHGHYKDGCHMMRLLLQDHRCTKAKSQPTSAKLIPKKLQPNLTVISAVIKKHSVFIQYIQLRTFLKFLRIPLRIGVGQLLSLHF